MNAQTNDDQ